MGESNASCILKLIMKFSSLDNTIEIIDFNNALICYLGHFNDLSSVSCWSFFEGSVSKFPNTLHAIFSYVSTVYPIHEPF